jgi:hypothetical protein
VFKKKKDGTLAAKRSVSIRGYLYWKFMSGRFFLFWNTYFWRLLNTIFDSWGWNLDLYVIWQGYTYSPPINIVVLTLLKHILFVVRKVVVVVEMFPTGKVHVYYCQTGFSWSACQCCGNSMCSYSVCASISCCKDMQSKVF